MKAGAKHAAWLADVDAHHASLEDVKAFSAKWARHPLITGLATSFCFIDPCIPTLVSSSGIAEMSIFFFIYVPL